jgi:hypothetical protein
MKRVIFMLMAFISSAVVSAQVYDYYFEDKDVFDMFPQLQKVDARTMVVKQMPPVDVDKLLEEDRELEGLDVPFRFGYAMDVDYTLGDGKWIEPGDGNRIWSMRFHSKGAYSLNFIFPEMFLSPEAELYIFSADGSMVYGPVTAQQNITTGKFLTGLVVGDDVIIQLIEPVASKEKSILKISQVVHGYQNTFAGLNGTSVSLLNCHNDVCNYPLWKDESDGVGAVLMEGTHLCSGALINNSSGDFRPYFLTAFHCHVGDVTSWAFRFQYKSPLCSASTVNYNSANFRAEWEDTDFLLVELQQAVLNDRLTFLGWDRSSSVSSTGTGIHHPDGSTMKISFDNQSLTTNSNPISIGGVPHSANSHWVVTYDSGTTEGGSSGSPLFNTNKRVIGQLDGGGSGCPPDVIKYYGRFDQSWTGGGTATTRLSNWLGTASTTNTIRFNISGPSLVPCSGNVTYTLPAAAASYTVNWNVGSLEIVSGQGTRTITVRKSASSTASSTLIQAAITSGITSYIRKSVDIGVPMVTSVTGPSSATTGSLCIFHAQPIFSEGDYEWMVEPSTATKSVYRNMCDITFLEPGSYTVGARSTSSCTSSGSYTTTYVSVSWPSSSYSISQGEFSSKIVTVTNRGAGVKGANQTVAYSLYNQATGVFATSGQMPASGGTLDFSRLPTGIYVLRIETSNGVYDTHSFLLK